MEYKKRIIIGRIVWGIVYIAFLISLWWSNSWEKYFPNLTIKILVTIGVVILWFYGLWASRRLVRYQESINAGGKVNPYLDKIFKAYGLLGRFSAIYLIIIGIIVALFGLFILVIGLIEYRAKAVLIGLLISLFGAGIIWFSIIVWRKSKSLVKGRLPKP